MAGCGTEADEPTVEPTDQGTQTDAASVTPTQEAAATDEPGQTDQAVRDAFAAAQSKVDFDLLLPGDVVGMTLAEDELRLSGPPSQPVVWAVFLDNSASPPRLLEFGQRADSLGQAPNDATTEPIDVQGHDGLLITETNESGGPSYQLRWEAAEIAYAISANNVALEDVLAFAESLR